MKKIVALLLVVGLCLSLSACGTSKYETLYKKYQPLIDALENDDFEDAYQELLSYQNGTATEDTGEGEKDDSAQKELVLGEWLTTREESEVKNVVFDKDNVTIDGAKYTYAIGDIYTAENFRVRVMEGDGLKYQLAMEKQSDTGLWQLSVTVPQGNGSFSYIASGLIRLADYTVVEITKDNFETYFELVEERTESKNSFGEVTTVYFTEYWVSKAGTDRVNMSMSNVALEYTYLAVDRKGHYDGTSKAYTLGDVTYTYNDGGVLTSTTQMGDIWADGEFRYYGVNIQSRSFDDFGNEESIYCREDITLTRVQGTLYLQKNTAE